MIRRSTGAGRTSTLLLIWFLTTLPCVLFAQNETVRNKGVKLLAEAGMNVELLSDARNGTLEAFVEDEFQLFASLTAAIDKLGNHNWESGPLKTEPGDFNLIDVLQTPVENCGEFFKIKGTIRRISPITITSTALAAQLGREVYYHVDFFVSTDRTSYRLKDDEGGVVIQGTYGITLILLDLPEIMQDAGKHTQFSLPGFFLKNWKHKTAETRGVSTELRRPNPIIFGLPTQARIVDVSSARNRVGFFGWILVGILAILVLLAACQLRSSPRRNQATAANPDSVDFSSLKNLD